MADFDRGLLYAFAELPGWAGHPAMVNTTDSKKLRTSISGLGLPYPVHMGTSVVQNLPKPNNRSSELDPSPTYTIRITAFSGRRSPFGARLHSFPELLDLPTIRMGLCSGFRLCLDPH